MVKKYILKILCLIIAILLLLNSNVFAKSYHFKAFISSESLANVFDLCDGTIAFMVSAMQKLEYNNYYGTNNYHVTSYKQDVLNYIRMTGNNYGLALLGHGSKDHITMNQADSNQDIYPSDISGIWHLVLVNSCDTYYNSAMAEAFKTVGYAHRASIGFNDTLYVGPAYEFWRYFDEQVGSTTLSNVVAYAKEKSFAPAVLYGDGSWNGYAWY